jgi:hypothetical protein
MEAAVTAMRAAAVRVQRDTMRVGRELREAEVARALAEARSQLDTVRLPILEMREEIQRAREALTADRALGVELEASARALREAAVRSAVAASDLDPALMEARLREVESRLQEQIRRLRQAIDRIP